PGRGDAPAHVRERVRAVRVRVDQDHHAGPRCGAGVDVGEVAAVRVAVDLEHRPRACGGDEDGVEVDRVGVPPPDLAAGRMSDRAHKWVLDGGDHALGHRLLGDPKGGVDACDHPVQAGEQLVLVVERAVGEDVDL